MNRERNSRGYFTFDYLWVAMEPGKTIFYATKKGEEGVFQPKLFTPYQVESLVNRGSHGQLDCGQWNMTGCTWVVWQRFVLGISLTERAQFLGKMPFL